MIECAACGHPKEKHVPSNNPHLCLICNCPGFTEPAEAARKAAELKERHARLGKKIVRSRQSENVLVALLVGGGLMLVFLAFCA